MLSSCMPHLRVTSFHVRATRIRSLKQKTWGNRHERSPKHTALAKLCHCFKLPTGTSIEYHRGQNDYGPIFLFWGIIWASVMSYRTEKIPAQNYLDR